MKMLIRLLTLSLCLFPVFALPACGVASTLPRPLPDGNIIFQSNMQRPYELNFIQADGSNHQKLELGFNFVKPFWSSDGEIVYGLSSPGGQWPYEDIGYPAYWNIKTGIITRCDENLPYYGKIEPAQDSNRPHEVILYNISEIVLFDLDTCQQTKTLVDFNQRRGEYEVSGFSYFPVTHELLYGRYSVPYESREHRLVKLNLKTGEQAELANGFQPAWSPDGTQIAYIGMDGMYVIRANEKQPRLLIKAQFFDPSTVSSPSHYAPQPRWSPDGEWLVYHQCAEKICSVEDTPIYKIRVSGGLPMKIFTGGKFPTWSPKPWSEIPTLKPAKPTSPGLPGPQDLRGEISPLRP